MDFVKEGSRLGRGWGWGGGGRGQRARPQCPAKGIWETSAVPALATSSQPAEPAGTAVLGDMSVPLNVPQGVPPAGRTFTGDVLCVAEGEQAQAVFVLTLMEGKDLGVLEQAPALFLPSNCTCGWQNLYGRWGGLAGAPREDWFARYGWNMLCAVTS